jgi:pimeloyl-ACP methyl ester carboxylesterase
MWGISYGGFTAIQVALLHPPHLAAIVPMMATDDRYTDDVHYLGGCMTVSELSQYAVSMVAMNALPALPAYRGAAWMDEWRDRLERTPVWLFEWLRRQHDGPYWRQGSVAPHWDRLTTPMFLIGGWMDEYVDAALRMLERCIGRAAPGPDRQLGPQLPGRRVPGPEPRLEPRARPVPRPLAEGDRQRGDGRARPRRVPPRMGAARAVPRRLARRLDRRDGVAAGGPS